MIIKRSLISIFIFFSLVIILILIHQNYIIYRSPEKAFFEYALKSNYYHANLINELDVNKNEKIYFWKDNNNQLASTIMNKNPFWGWKVNSSICFVDMNKTGNNNFIWGVLNSKNNQNHSLGLYIGFIKTESSNILKILINNKQANIFKVENGYIWYLYSEYTGSNVSVYTE